MVTTLAVAGGRAALLSGLAPLLLLAGVLLLVMAAPGSKERIIELKERFYRASSALPEPVRACFGVDDTSAQSGGDAPAAGWQASDPEQFAEFYTQLIDGDDDTSDTDRR